MCRLVKLPAYKHTYKGGVKCFKAAKKSKITTLEKFANQKEKCIYILAVHTVFQVETNNLE